MRVENIYKGYWYFHSDTASVAGTLIIGKRIVLRLIDLNKTIYKQPIIDFLRGIVITENSDILYFILYDLSRAESVANSQGVQSYEYSVSYLVYSSKSLLHKKSSNILNTNKIIINNSYLSRWCRSLIKDQKYDLTQKEIEYHYINPQPILLSKLDNCSIYALIVSSTKSPYYEGFCNKLEAHLEIVFWNSLELKKSFAIVKKIESLLCLFMSTPVVNDSISFTSDGTSCICVHNIAERHYNYRQKSEDTVMFTSNIHDIANNHIIEHWCDFYNEEEQALNLYFDTIYNEELTDELRIICYSSVLEELTKRYYSTTLPTLETRKRKMLQSIIDILKKDNHLKEANNLKTCYLDRDDTFEARLLSILRKHQDIWELLNIEDFAKKAVVTRNFLVHRQIPENMASFLYAPQEYEKLARTLRFIIAATLLKELTIDTKDITRILSILIGGIWTYEDYVKAHPETGKQVK